MGSASAASGAVALYHVEGVTPEAKEKGRKLLAKGHKTYVIDDAEQARVLATFKNLWIEKDGDPNAAFLGCPHLTYDELLKWGRMVTTSLDLAGKEKAAMPVYLFVANPVRNRLVEEEGELASRMKRAGMRATNMCMMTYASMKGFSEKVRGVTNSGKGRNYSNLRIFPDQTLVEIIVTGKIPKGA
jgi:predicted aconitase